MKTKLLLSLAVIVLLACFSFSCSDDETPYECTTCVTTPEALAANDASGKGIYKGLVVGSSGTIKFNIANSGTTIDAVLILDDETIPLVTTATYSLSSGFEGYFTNAAKGIEIGFYVTVNGFDYSVFSISIPGHAEAQIIVIKELSTSLVKVFEGSYSGDGNGTFNMMIRGSEWEALTDEEYYFIGTVNGANELSCTGIDCQYINVTGKIIDDVVSGNWTSNFNDDEGKWKGERTL